MKRFVCYTNANDKEIEPTWFVVTGMNPGTVKVKWLGGSVELSHWKSIGKDYTDEPGGINDGAPGSNRRFQTDDVNDLSDEAVTALMKMELLQEERK